MRLDSKGLFDIYQNLTQKIIKAHPGTVIFVTNGLNDQEIKIIWLGIEKSEIETRIAAFKKAINEEDNNDFINHLGWEDSKLEIYISDTAIIEKLAGVVSDSSANAVISNANDLPIVNNNQKPIDKLLAIINQNVAHQPSAIALSKAISALSKDNLQKLADSYKDLQPILLKLCLAIQLVMLEIEFTRPYNGGVISLGHMPWIIQKAVQEEFIVENLTVVVPLAYRENFTPYDILGLEVPAFLEDIFKIKITDFVISGGIKYVAACDIKTLSDTKIIDSILSQGVKYSLPYFLGNATPEDVTQYFLKVDRENQLHLVPHIKLFELGQGTVTYPGVLVFFNNQFIECVKKGPDLEGSVARDLKTTPISSRFILSTINKQEKPASNNNNNDEYKIFQSVKDELEDIINRMVTHQPSAVALQESFNALNEENLQKLASNYKGLQPILLKLCLAIQLVIMEMRFEHKNNTLKLPLGKTPWIIEKDLKDDRFIVKSIASSLIDKAWIMGVKLFVLENILNFIDGIFETKHLSSSKRDAEYYTYHAVINFERLPAKETLINTILSQGVKNALPYFLGYRTIFEVDQYFAAANKEKKLEDMPHLKIDGQYYPSILAIHKYDFFIYYWKNGLTKDKKPIYPEHIRPLNWLLNAAPKQAPSNSQSSLIGQHYTLFASAKEELENIINKIVTHAPSAAILKASLNSLSDDRTAGLAFNYRGLDKSMLKLCLAIQLIMTKIVSQKKMQHVHLDTFWIYHTANNKHIIKSFLLPPLPTQSLEFYLSFIPTFLSKVLELNFVHSPLPEHLRYQCEFELPLSLHTNMQIDSILLKGMEDTMEYSLDNTDFKNNIPLF